MATLELVHLVLHSAHRPPAQVQFADGLTLIHGPSDTGKSFIASALDFMLGSRGMQDPTELASYQNVLLGLRVRGVEYTLLRAITGGRFFLYEGLHDEPPREDKPRVLASKHTPGDSSLSGWLLQACGLEGNRLRKNARNETTDLSFRDLAHLTIIDETKIQSLDAPPFTGSVMTRTKETSALKLLLQGEDDTGLVAEPKSDDVRRLKNARLDVVEELIANTSQRLEGVPPSPELDDQLARITATLDTFEDRDRQVHDERRRLTESIARNRVRIRAANLRRTEVAGLRARFGLLREQYELDIDRLEAIVEGGSLLGYFSSGSCPLCGADPEHQHRPDLDLNPAGLIPSVRSEQSAIRALLLELNATFDDLDVQDARMARIRQSADQAIEGEQTIVRRLDGDRSEQMMERRSLLDRRTEVERNLLIYAQLRELESVRSRIDLETAAEIEVQTSAIPSRIIDEFSTAIARRLTAWGYPADDIRYDRVRQDIYAGGQFRADHGKGARSLLHAAFTIGLADYCLERDLPHPGFVVLDSPLITYRAPDAHDWDESSVASIASRMYKDLEDNFLGQVVILENTEADGELGEGSGDVRFTANDSGRYGFFPRE